MNQSLLQFTLTAFVMLIVVINPVAVAPIFVAVTNGMAAGERRSVLNRALLIAFGVALFFLVAGRVMLSYLSMTMATALWRDWIAFYALLAGIIGAVAAAVFGIIDWLSIKDHEVKKIADWHARLNVIALLIFVASFYLRTGAARGW